MTAAPPLFPPTRLARRALSFVPGSPRLRKIPVGHAPNTEPNGDPGLLRVCL
jgi:hypothetical protein